MLLESLATKFYLWDLWVSLQNLSTRFARSESCYEISFCKTLKKRFSLWNFVARLASHKSHYEISVCETREKRVLLLILTRENLASLARILGKKASLASWENFKKWFSCQPYYGHAFDGYFEQQIFLAVNPEPQIFWTADTVFKISYWFSELRRQGSQLVGLSGLSFEPFFEIYLQNIKCIEQYHTYCLKELNFRYI